MPVVIQELVVRVVVDPGGDAAQPVTSGTLGEEERRALIEAAVEETLRILRQERER